ncbi:MAG: EamA family transporter RarD, partial [Chromatiales bacterium]|nr:EamA family transporter RarD [Chromatiales bacterium]
MNREHRSGVVLGLLAFIFWGFSPIYFKAVSTVLPTEVLSHRVIWSFLLLSLLLGLRGHLYEFSTLLKQRKLLFWFFISALLVSANWLVFIWAISNDLILESSLGYFINPLFSVLLGMIFLRERLRPLQWLAILFAMAGVTYKIILVGSLPWVSLTLAITFGLYGLIRKKINADPIQGLAVETLLLSPVAIGYLIWLSLNQQLGFFNVSWELSLLLIAAGL